MPSLRLYFPVLRKLLVRDARALHGKEAAIEQPGSVVTSIIIWQIRGLHFLESFQELCAVELLSGDLAQLADLRLPQDLPAKVLQV